MTMIKSSLFAVQKTSRNSISQFFKHSNHLSSRKIICKPTTAKLGTKMALRPHRRLVHVTRCRKNNLREVNENEFTRKPAPHLPGQPGQPGPNDPPVPVGRNYVVGGVITSFVIGVYSYTVYQMKKQNEMDFLDDIDDEVQRQNEQK